jgi:hypothetical protein
MNLKKEFSLLRTLGLLLLVGGLIVGFFFLTSYDTSVEVPTQEILGQTVGGGRVNNIGLMNTRQNGINLGFGAFVVGLLILGFQSYNKKQVHSS